MGIFLPRLGPAPAGPFLRYAVAAWSRQERHPGPLPHVASSLALRAPRLGPAGGGPQPRRSSRRSLMRATFLSPERLLHPFRRHRRLAQALAGEGRKRIGDRSEEHTSELQSPYVISY